MNDDNAIYDFIEKLSKNNLSFSIMEEVNLVYNESKWVVFDGAYTVEESVHCKLEVDVSIKFNKIITFSYEDNLSSFLVHYFI
ncbi:hypothetical protein RO21_06720 [[Actinobacillus] muris]|uniref:Uncharacterized protein n=1 Tax=Muribacter muris TaxID=67855 RepID=A0A0J5P6K3_9PAST|nr:hypothetical protein [Muribacter muris]KMK51395.1 hypothetical protein RO21_06720 [[Actinobacillus] muris] [Muribacter muris]